MKESKEDNSKLSNLIYNLELSLLKTDVRKSAEKISELIADDFKEFTSSGNIGFYTKGDTYQNKDDNTELNWEIKNFEIQKLCENYVLATYKVIKHNYVREDKKYSLRSSIWRLSDGRWKMCFHQGTLTSRF